MKIDGPNAVDGQRGPKVLSRHWGWATLVNVGAAIVAALTFGAWQRHQQPPAGSSYMGGDFYEPADDVGYIPQANAQMNARAEVEGRTIYDVVYRTGPDHFRVVPEATERPDACVLLFGDSFTFGDGVGDRDTYGAQIVQRSGRRVAVHNFAVSGWGPHQFLAGLQSGRFSRAVRCSPTDAVFLMIPSLIWRAAGVTNPWDRTGPRYRVEQDGQPVRDGALGDHDPYNWRRWIGLRPISKGDAMELSVAVIAEAMSELKRLYPGIRTRMILYRVASWIDVDLSVDDLVAFEYQLHEAGVTPLPLEAIIPRYRFSMNDYILDPTDFHPNARAHRLIAEFILRKIEARPQAFARPSWVSAGGPISHSFAPLALSMPPHFTDTRLFGEIDRSWQPNANCPALQLTDAPTPIVEPAELR